MHVGTQLMPPHDVTGRPSVGSPQAFDAHKFKQACKDGDLSAVRSMNPQDLTTTNGQAYSFEQGFHEACTAGHLEVVQFLLTCSIISSYVNCISTGFEKACKAGQANIVELLLKKVKDGDKVRGFNAACKAGQQEIVKALLASHTFKNKNIADGFHTACAEGQQAIVKLLLNHTNTKGKLLQQHIVDGFKAACYRGHETTAQLLLNHTNTKDELSRQNIADTFQIVCQTEHVCIARLLINTKKLTNENVVGGFKAACSAFNDISFVIYGDRYDYQRSQRLDLIKYLSIQLPQETIRQLLETEQNTEIKAILTSKLTTNRTSRKKFGLLTPLSPLFYLAAGVANSAYRLLKAFVLNWTRKRGNTYEFKARFKDSLKDLGRIAMQPICMLEFPLYIFLGIFWPQKMHAWLEKREAQQFGKPWLSRVTQPPPQYEQM